MHINLFQSVSLMSLFFRVSHDPIENKNKRQHRKNMRNDVKRVGPE